MQYFPLFLDLAHKPVLVVGGGEVASRKVDTLIRANAKVTVVSPELADYLKEYADNGKIKWVQSHYCDDHITDFIQVWATTNNSELNHQVHKDAKKKNILVNVVDDIDYCDFITPSIVNRGKIQIAISSGGGSPVLVRYIREKIEKILAQNVELLADFASGKRDDIKEKLPSVKERRLFWEAFFSNKDIENVNNIKDLEQIYNDSFKRDCIVTASQFWLEFDDDVELLSIKALRIMQATELVLYPEDCPFPFVDLCRRDAERVRYKNESDIGEIIEQFQEEGITSTCIFIRKNSADTNEVIKKQVNGATVLKIAS